MENLQLGYNLRALALSPLTPAGQILVFPTASPPPLLRVHHLLRQMLRFKSRSRQTQFDQLHLLVIRFLSFSRVRRRPALSAICFNLLRAISSMTFNMRQCLITDEARQGSGFYCFCASRNHDIRTQWWLILSKCKACHHLHLPPISIKSKQSDASTPPTT